MNWREKYKPRKIKIGDRLKVRNDLVSGTRYDKCMFAHGMERFRGQIVTIKSKNNDRYKISSVGWDYNWTKEMFEGDFK